MQFFRLNSLYKPDVTVKIFDSLVWTERYQDAGDFQLVTQNEITILDVLPKGSLISHTDTKEVMIVENHEIIRDKDKNLKITISGRSFETFAENRLTAGSALALENIPVPPAQPVANVETSALLPACTVGFNIMKGSLEPGTASADDAIPNLLMVQDVSTHVLTMVHIIKRGDIYTRALEFLKVCNAGIKILRPDGAQTTLNIVIHDGTDRSASVIFYAQNEDLDDAKYFWSIKDYKNYARVAGKIYSRLYRQRDVLSDVTGLNRRILYVEADDLEGNYTPPTLTDVISARGQLELDNHRITTLMEARISIAAKPKFKIHYDIGDLVTVYGDFRTVQVMRVTEHILTVDKQGQRGFPSLSII